MSSQIGERTTMFEVLEKRTTGTAADRSVDYTPTGRFFRGRLRENTRRFGEREGRPVPDCQYFVDTRRVVDVKVGDRLKGLGRRSDLLLSVDRPASVDVPGSETRLYCNTINP